MKARIRTTPREQASPANSYRVVYQTPEEAEEMRRHVGPLAKTAGRACSHVWDAEGVCEVCGTWNSAVLQEWGTLEMDYPEVYGGLLDTVPPADYIEPGYMEPEEISEYRNVVLPETETEPEITVPLSKAQVNTGVNPADLAAGRKAVLQVLQETEPLNREAWESAYSLLQLSERRFAIVERQPCRHYIGNDKIGFCQSEFIRTGSLGEYRLDWQTARELLAQLRRVERAEKTAANAAKESGSAG